MSMPPLASRRPLLPPPSLKCGVTPSRLRRVNTWITPPIASEPYRLERGPRTISMRSISSTGRSCNAVRPEVAEPTRTPSIRNRVWSDSAPRMNSVVSLPRPPWLTSEMPARPRSSSGSERAWLRSICSRSITSTAASESSTVIAVRVPVTTTVSRSVAAASVVALVFGVSCAAAKAGRANAMAMTRESRSNIDASPARTPARIAVRNEVAGEEGVRAEYRRAGMAAAMPSASQPVRRADQG